MTYPGQGLSLSQLIFALGEELKCMAYRPPPTFDQISQLSHDASTAFAAINEMRNSLAPVNRIPLDILLLIPTHLSSHNDRLRASFVCRRWRRTFLQRGDLWSELLLSNGEVYANTFLERAQGYALDILADYRSLVDNRMVLSSYTEQIRCLNFVCDGWLDIQRVADIMSGPLPLLRTLAIQNISEEFNSTGLTPPSPPLFSYATNLKAFRFQSESLSSPFLNHFFFPNLVSFNFSTVSRWWYHTGELLDFLEGSPMLQMVHIEIFATPQAEHIPRERVVILRSVKTFNLILGNGEQGISRYKIARHIFCPSVRSALFVHTGGCRVSPEEMFPSSWGAVFSKYARHPIEEVTLEIIPLPAIVCRLAFWSTHGTMFEMRFQVEEVESQMLPLRIHSNVYDQAIRTLQRHPQLKNIKRLRICHSFRAAACALVTHVASTTWELFRSLGPLDELTIYDCDVRPYVSPFLSHTKSHIQEPFAFPPTKQLTISDPERLTGSVRLAIVKLAEFQFILGRPFERVVFHGTPMRELEELKRFLVTT